MPAAAQGIPFPGRPRTNLFAKRAATLTVSGGYLDRLGGCLADEPLPDWSERYFEVEPEYA